MIGRTLSIALLGALVCFAQEQTATLTGTLIDPFGAPIEGHVVQLTSERGQHFFLNAPTDKTGQFRFDVPPGSYSVFLGTPGIQTWGKRGIQLAEGQQVSFPTIVLNLSAACGEPSFEAVQRLTLGDDSGTLRGSVIDSRDSPIIGARVSLSCVGCVTKTNEKGQFVFPQMTPGDYTLTVSMVGSYKASVYRSVVKNLDRTYSPILLEQCHGKGCERRTKRRPKIIYCER